MIVLYAFICDRFHNELWIRCQRFTNNDTPDEESADGINLGKRTNQSFVNGQFADKISYKLEAQDIGVVRENESYTSKASFFDNDPLPGKYEPDKKYHFSGKRIRRGLYRTAKGILVNADINGASDIIRKVVPEFNKDGIAERSAPHCGLLTVHLGNKVCGIIITSVL